MNIELTERAKPMQVVAQRFANDRFRWGFDTGALLLSPGIVGLGATAQARIIAAVRAFDDFDDDDLSDTHTLGDLEVVVSPEGQSLRIELIFFRIDHSVGSGDTRILSIMLASEW